MTKADEEQTKKTPEGASLDSLRLNTANYSTIFDTLKAYALAVVSNAHSEMSEEQWGEYLNEVTGKYAEALATERKKAVQQFAAEVKGKAVQEVVEIYDDGSLLMKDTQHVPISAIEEALESYES